MATCKNLNMNSKKKSISKDHVVKELDCLFGQTLHIEIIKSVASSCDFDINRSSNLLLEMTSNVQNDGQEITERVVGKAKRKPPNNFPSPLVRKVEGAQRLPTSVSSGAIAKKSKKTLEFERVITSIQQGFKVLVILRGLPGSGKSYLAKRIAQVTLGPGNVDHHILSTDDYFKTPNGYDYDPARIQQAHQWNHTRALKTMIQGLSPVIIDNTNCQMWEMKPYAMMAMDYGYYVEILEPDTWWCFNDKELAKRNVHGVPKIKIKDMIDRYDKNITAQKLLSMYSLRYEFGKNPPQFRTHPPINNSRRTANQINGHANFDTDASGSVRKSRSASALGSAFEMAEPLNLMDFDDTKLNHNNEAVSIYSTMDKSNNLVDEILMCPKDNNSSILQPEVPTFKQDVNKLYDDGHKAWGLDEQALQSWDMVAHLECASAGPVAQESFATFSEVAEENELKEIGTNVDPDMIMAITRGEVPEGFKTLRGTSRYISSGSVSKVPFSTPKKVKHDKSCWTDGDLDDDDTEDETVIQQLLSLFPSVRRSYMKHLYNSCSKNFNMTMDVLVEDNSHHLVDGSKIDSNESDSEDIFGAASLSAQNHYRRSSPVETPTRKMTTPKHVSKEAVELKKALENKVDIDKRHYSKHVLKVKQYKFGHYDEQPGLELVDMSSSPPDVDNAEGSSDEGSCDFYEGNPKDLVELNLGEVFSAQLEAKFGFLEDLQGFQPVIQMPVELARQIYMLYLESVFQQMDAQKQVLEQMAKEDEEFARKLQSKEDELVQPQRELNLNEIMDEQIAANYYKRDAERWKSMSADNISAKLTRQKLFTAFPFVDQDSILEILNANNNNYSKTVEDLYSSVGPDCAHGLKEAIEQPPLSADTLTEMKEAEQICSDTPKVVTESQEIHPATYYREQANTHLQRRTDLYQKAQSYYQRGMTEVAMFYSDLATKETQSFDKANNLAANVFLQEHSQRLQNHNTLDLHYLYVKEAIAALDVFVDQNIDALHGRSRDLYQELYIITGRGKNSHGGVSKIKPAVITRLKKRKMMFSELNPGLLKIKVTRNTLLSCDFPT